MPLPISAAPAGSMPSGGSNLPSGDGTSLTAADSGNGAVAGAQAGAAAGTVWMPIFQIGVGQGGVPADARGLIAGEQPQGGSLGTQVGATADKALAAATAAGAAAGQSGPAAGAAAGASEGSALAGGGGGDSANAGGNPTAKASSQAQRDANNAEAARENPGYKGAG
jgi:hypothetical protein